MEENINMEEKKEVQEEKTVVNNTSQNMPPVKNNNGLIGILVFIIILLMAGLVYVLFFTKDKKELEENNTNNTQETENNTEPEKKEEEEKDKYYDMYVYVSKYGSHAQIFGSYTEDALKVGIKAKSANAKFITSDYDNTGNFFLYDDDGLKLYDIKNKKATSLDISVNYKSYHINMSEDGKSVIGISYTDNNNLATYYNLKNKKEMYKNKYKVSEDYYFSNINDKYLRIETDSTSYLLSAESEKVIMSYGNSKDDYFKHSYNSYGENGKYIYSLELCYDDGCTIKKLYNDQMKEFFSSEIVNETGFSLHNNMIYVNDDNTIKKYNMNGDLQSSKNYDEVEQIIRNYVVYVKDGTIVLENFDNNDENKEIVKLDKDWYLDTYDSGYYTSNDLKNLEEDNKKEGLYIVIDYSGKDSNGYYGMEYCYNKGQELVEYPIKEEMGGRAKPVLYLYPEKETNVTVTFAHPEYLTTTYPKYINSWNVTAKPNGDLYDKEGKYYYALYWDEVRYNEVDFSKGFYVESKDAIKFLEEKLTIIGLNDKERNEFIMYWLPIMEKNGKNLVYFELTEEREASNKLIIIPKPDSLLRVSIHIKKVNEKTNIKEQKLPTFKRSGFTAVEWGGMTY